MSDMNENDTIIVQPDDSILLQIRINGVMLAPQLLPLTTVSLLPLIANAQLSTYQNIAVTQQGEAATKTD